MTKAIVVVGTGYWGKNLVRNFHELGALRGICDIDDNALKAFRGTYPEIRTYSAIEAVFRDPEVRAVAVATPATTHYRVVKDALLAGKDVFVEKPLALCSAEAEELIAAASVSGRVLMIGHILRYHPAITKLKEMIDSGELGNIRYIYSHRLNLGKIRTEENILWSFAPHDISIILFLLNETPQRVSAHAGSYLNPDIADVTVTTMDFPSGARSHIFVSWLHPYKEQKLVLVGEDKMVVFDDVRKEDKLLVYPHKIDWIDGQPVARPDLAVPVAIEKKEPLKVECQHFCECLATRRTPHTDGAEGLRVLKVLEACQASLQSNRKDIVLMSPTDKTYFVHESAYIDDNVEIGEGTKIWHFSHVHSGARIGKKCVLGQNVNIGNNVTIGNFVKIQNNVSVYEGVTLEDYVFCGPSMVFTNITDPRSKYPQVGSRFYKPTLVKEGASLGANSTIVCGHTIGRFAFVGAGAVVTKEVPDFALVVGSPARVAGWMSEAGRKLTFDKDGFAFCKKSNKGYKLESGRVTEVR